MAPFSRLFDSSFSSDRSSSRRTTHSGYDKYDGSSSSRLTRPFNTPYGDYSTTSRCEVPDSSALRRAASQREPYDSRYNYRGVSPIRGSEHPRAYTNNHAYDDHRSVSPLGTSRFEQPSMSSCQFSAFNMGGALANRSTSYATSSRDTSRSTSFEIGRGHDGYGRPSTSGGGLSRSGAVRGGNAPRRMEDDGMYGARLGRERRPNIGPNFRGGDFNWSHF
ncbi:hypothetical protein G6011_05011 [Alternaria panax]|uniref:Uncharacterized protein n=1 Tax=Alternaria panax TaxID=48097 RepID=A0AAD4I343_9PLEO|nr:hypothetical protein G6011_05011 [Alternaria panax]